jgi:hypothetical protein
LLADVGQLTLSLLLLLFFCTPSQVFQAAAFHSSRPEPRSFLVQHRAQSFTESWRVALSVVVNGAVHGNLEQLFFVSQNRKVARLFD